MARINPEFTNELKKFGAFDTNACYNCGNCTAVCSLSDEDNSFPRKMIRYSVLGLESEIQTSLDPWLCYYCGECSTTCPREADPGELMMSLRRWLSAKYDWTGLSGLLYKSKTASAIAFLLLLVAVVWFAAYEQFNIETVMHYGHFFEMAAITLVFTLILLPNIIHMWWLTVLKPGIKAPLFAYFKATSELVVHMFTQKRTLGCDDSQVRWVEHFILVLAYLSLLFTTVFLNWFSSQSVFVIVLGYVESVLIFLVTFDFIRRRIQKNDEVSKYSHPSDWLFVIWLFLIGLTAFVVRLFIDFNFLVNNIWLYLVHLIVMVQWALLIVPFGKWTHFLYRSFAIYFNCLTLAPQKLEKQADAL
ncbi:MAG: 4Fe-4S dicluster domain-containing protein [Prolixibacteraceae bacterium]|jgi:ferredoxin|nr:4Fe-4S dicluster domain-containing protein [Prolixibacteraceae bacterium]MBT6763284.1 4Fe-4S dicluster domain-containing protein [Prolixibacteraceae bacterium]MBT6998912.1 4Fe-4S dicluster domain-containing protein [Prolixibacteraceae bacterium]MBT7395170.1 4Fe-4S dicluster domain-containing protein [Prolixibacteraceae bacterium]